MFKKIKKYATPGNAILYWFCLIFITSCILLLNVQYYSNIPLNIYNKQNEQQVLNDTSASTLNDSILEGIDRCKNDIKDLQQINFTIIIIDNEKIKERLLQGDYREIQAKRQEYQNRIELEEIKKNSLIISLTTDNQEKIRDEFANLQTLINNLENERDRIIQKMESRVEEKFQFCTRKAIGEYCNVHSDEYSRTIAIFDTANIYSNMQKQDDSSCTMITFVEATDEVSGIALKFFVDYIDSDAS